MNTRPRIWNAAHIVEKPAHLSQRQGLIGLDGSTTGVHEGDVVFLGLDGFQRPALLGQILEQVKEERAEFIPLEQAWGGRQGPRTVAMVNVKTK